MSTSPVYLALAAISVHSIFFISIFDIYFTSPIDRGMTPQYYSMEPPARRLVLFVTDGLRADTMFSLDENGNSPAPFLRRVVEYQGRWGVSHTRVPTESRPGHVALIAGFYEDVSAVTRGWTENPVDFDSVFNKSRHTWSWGSPDILPMFAKGAVPGRVETFMYDATWEDFASSDPSKLDTWVFEKVEDLFHQSLKNETLAQMLSQDKIVFFLHLLGIDTNGHAHRPKSQEVQDNLRLVDEGIEKMSKMIDSYYGDDKTAYIVTADHGMTDWGSHGAGLPEETMTPLICWGAGIKGPRSSHHGDYIYHDGYTEKWGLEELERIDVEEADITPLMAVLIGIPIPLNSEGVLPVGYLHYNRAFSAETLFANVRQLMEQVRVKAERIEHNSLPFTFRPFTKLITTDMTQRRQEINELIKQKKYERAVDLLQKLAALCKEGMHYYHTYHRLSLKTALTLGFVGWMISILISTLEESMKYKRTTLHSHRFPVKTSLVCTITWGLLLYQASSPLYYFYYTIPILCWAHIWRKKSIVWHTFQLARLNPVQMFKLVVLLLFGTCGLELMVLSFFHREFLSVLLVLISLWPYFTEMVQKQLKLCVLWTITCLMLAVFPLLPVIGRNSNYTFVSVSGITAVLVTCYLLAKPQLNLILVTSQSKIRSSALLKVQITLLCIATFLPAITNWYFSQKQTIPVIIQTFSWCMLPFCHVAPVFGTRSLLGRLVHIALALYTIFLLLSTTFEAVFMLLFCVALYLWLVAEESIAPKQNRVSSLWESVISFHVPKVVTLMPNEALFEKRGASLDDARQVWFCLFFGLLSFFGTGNIASINTFDPSTVYCFQTVFSPFVMGGLIIWKMAIPFILVSCVYNAITLLLKRPLKTSLLLMLIISDIMGLNFFFLVQDSGSWLEIGISISHFVIVMVMIMGIVVLLGVAKLLTGIAILPRKIEDHVC